MNLTNKYFSSEQPIEEFLEWCRINIYAEKENNINIDEELKNLKNFIYKMAYWYELNHPTAKKEEELYSYQMFLEGLSPKEKSYLSNIKYSKIFLSSNCKEGRIYFSKDGKVESADNMNIAENGYMKDITTELLSQPIEKVLQKLKEYNCLEDVKKLEKIIEEYNKSQEFKEKLLNTIMYKIMDSSNPRLSCKRGLFFAEEFKRDIKIPVTYAVDNHGLTEAFLKEVFSYGLSNGQMNIGNIIADCQWNSTISSYDIETISSLMQKYENTLIKRQFLQTIEKTYENEPEIIQNYQIMKQIDEKKTKRDQICQTIEKAGETGLRRIKVPRYNKRGLN